jgi:hypothetical protein
VALKTAPMPSTEKAALQPKPVIGTDWRSRLPQTDQSGTHCEPAMQTKCMDIDSGLFCRELPSRSDRIPAPVVSNPKSKDFHNYQEDGPRRQVFTITTTTNVTTTDRRKEPPSKRRCKPKAPASPPVVQQESQARRMALSRHQERSGTADVEPEAA